MTDQRLRIAAVIKGVLAEYRVHARLLMPFALVIAALSDLKYFRGGSGLGQPPIVGIGAGLAGGVVFGAVAIGAVGWPATGRPSLRELRPMVRRKIWTLVGAGVVSSICIAIGLLLLVVPGLYVMTRWLLYAPVILLEDAKAMESFEKSNAIVRGNGWPVLGVALLLGLSLVGINLAKAALLGAVDGGISLVDWLVAVPIDTLLLPLWPLTLAVLYKQLKSLKQEQLAEE